MIEKLKAPISVYSFYNHRKRVFFPGIILWEGRRYNVTKVGYHHTYRLGRVLYHVFSVATKELYFRLVCNTENLSWEVEEISDGQVN
jgi:hypothetical protein